MLKIYNYFYKKKSIDLPINSLFYKIEIICKLYLYNDIQYIKIEYSYTFLKLDISICNYFLLFEIKLNLF